MADAALGEPDAALARLEALIARHAGSDNPLVLGLLHESRARVAHAHGRHVELAESLREATRWLRGTGTPALVAITERLGALSRSTPVAPTLGAAHEGASATTVQQRVGP